ncbi:DUF4345 domain-containing protein [Aequorivita sp. H23M31]|uniref:DUF4345 domain-containing protein n=1 Tax=Aequorivita ciconiae TaxID=2494375 RepID=A0A451FS94_9FLAO|nr:DUF4345 family protein [Aequorivita sp. H23M31]QAA80254.1 DUF4345 domain-containing protein [Aequorivita sp. H23M31]
MDLTLQILLAVVALICLLGGLNLLLKGAHYFLPKDIPIQRVMDDLFRFLSGIYFGMGFLLAWVVFNFHKTGDIIYFLGIVVAFSGLGRWYSRIKVGPAGKYFDFIMTLEILLGIIIILLQYLR